MRRALKGSGLPIGDLGAVHSSPDEICDSAAFRERKHVFAFVRHPLTWYRSMWAHRVAEEWGDIDDLDWFSPRWLEHWADFTAAGTADTFEDYVRGIVSRYPDGFLSELFRVYTEGCTAVGRYESLATDLVRILSDYERGFDVRSIVETPPRNVRGSRPEVMREARYSRELEKVVLRAERELLDRFGYGAPA